MPATVKALNLHLSTDVEIKFEQVDAIAPQHAFELGRLAQEVGQLVGRTKPITRSTPARVYQEGICLPPAHCPTIPMDNAIDPLQQG